ncbi:MAG TPA: bifunctional pyr operon transcriptional regulator/uracil phosphoribosyltransferase PyrR [Chitinophagales bacterium]|nr:bifunctional pyr operon transcriptional regulator/uracil phosphoribosyltransferase PyrR [Chitinophagales bacterium]
MPARVILDSKKFALTIDRLCYQLIENHKDFSNMALIGIQPRGVHLSDRLFHRLKEIRKGVSLKYGVLDITFYRDDFRRSEKVHTASDTTIDFSVEGKDVVLVDDVLFTARTVRAAFDALLDFGRPDKVELLVLIDRRLSRQMPIQPTYVGKTIDAIESEYVKVEWKEIDGEDKVLILPKKE